MKDQSTLEITPEISLKVFIGTCILMIFLLIYHAIMTITYDCPDASIPKIVATEESQ